MRADKIRPLLLDVESTVYQISLLLAVLKNHLLNLAERNDTS